MSKLDVAAFVEGQVKAIREALGEEKALIAVSGGVDSTVSAVLTHKALGDNLTCIFLDDHFMRLGEPDMVKAALSAPPLNLPVRVLKEKNRFMEALEGLSDAEEKRKAFRDTFYQTLSDVAWAENCKYLVQGTIKADIEETAGGIKTQHNILEQIGIDPVEKFGYKIVEPIASLYKYQVREVARFLGMPSELSERQPFPGPGLSVRVVGEITEEKIDQLKAATQIVEDAFKKNNPAQYFVAIMSGGVTDAPKILRREAASALDLEQAQIQAMYLTEKATGIIEGKRSYGFVAAVEVLDKEDRPIDVGYNAVERIRKEIQSNFPEVSRVLQLIATRSDDEGYYISMRAVETKDFLTADISKIPWTTLESTAKKILSACPKVIKVYYDVTPKPPATVEYE
ncbi:GMP synthase [Thaumarchaeota archaeon SCGC AB-539-E09]|nr:GMP synthase [Thaumarchaeota archaeon SCGC AB-539-E09]